MPHRIVVAEDDPSVRLLVFHALAARGFEIVEAPDGVAALSAVSEQIPCALVTDISMPRLDGVRLVAQLRAQEDTATIPVVVMTALPRDDTRVAVLRGTERVQVLHKPFAIAELARLLMEFCAS